MERSYSFMIGVFLALGALSWWSESSMSAQKWPSDRSFEKTQADSAAKVLTPVSFNPTNSNSGDSVAAVPMANAADSFSPSREPAGVPSSQPLEIESLDP
jgi:hypothetical protein